MSSEENYLSTVMCRRVYSEVASEYEYADPTEAAKEVPPPLPPRLLVGKCKHRQFNEHFPSNPAVTLLRCSPRRSGDGGDQISSPPEGSSVLVDIPEPEASRSTAATQSEENVTVGCCQFSLDHVRKEDIESEFPERINVSRAKGMLFCCVCNPFSWFALLFSSWSERYLKKSSRKGKEKENKKASLVWGEAALECGFLAYALNFLCFVIAVVVFWFMLLNLLGVSFKLLSKWGRSPNATVQEVKFLAPDEFNF